MMFTGTNQQQDTRFSDKEKKLLKQMKFGDCLNKRVDMSKVKLDVLRPWISKKITDILHIEDDVVVEFVYNQLEEEKYPCPKKMQINMTGFLNGKNARQFMGELWALLLSAQESDSGIPAEFIQQKKDEILKREEEQRQEQAKRDRSRSPFGKDRDRDRDIDRDKERSSRKDRGGRERSKEHSIVRDLPASTLSAIEQVRSQLSTNSRSNSTEKINLSNTKFKNSSENVVRNRSKSPNQKSDYASKSRNRSRSRERRHSRDRSTQRVSRERNSSPIRRRSSRDRDRRRSRSPRRRSVDRRRRISRSRDRSGRQPNHRRSRSNSPPNRNDKVKPTASRRSLDRRSKSKSPETRKKSPNPESRNYSSSPNTTKCGINGIDNTCKTSEKKLTKVQGKLFDLASGNKRNSSPSRSRSKSTQRSPVPSEHKRNVTKSRSRSLSKRKARAMSSSSRSATSSRSSVRLDPKRKIQRSLSRDSRSASASPDNRRSDFEIQKSKNSVQKKRHYRNNRDSSSGSSVERAMNDRIGEKRRESYRRQSPRGKSPNFRNQRSRSRRRSRSRSRSRSRIRNRSRSLTRRSRSPRRFNRRWSPSFHHYRGRGVMNRSRQNNWRRSRSRGRGGGGGGGGGGRNMSPQRRFSPPRRYSRERRSPQLQVQQRDRKFSPVRRHSPPPQQSRRSRERRQSPRDRRPSSRDRRQSSPLREFSRERRTSRERRRSSPPFADFGGRMKSRNENRWETQRNEKALGVAQRGKQRVSSESSNWEEDDQPDPVPVINKESPKKQILAVTSNISPIKNSGGRREKSKSRSQERPKTLPSPIARETAVKSKLLPAEHSSQERSDPQKERIMPVSSRNEKDDSKRKTKSEGPIEIVTKQQQVVIEEQVLVSSKDKTSKEISRSNYSSSLSRTPSPFLKPHEREKTSQAVITQRKQFDKKPITTAKAINTNDSESSTSESSLYSSEIEEEKNIKAASKKKNEKKVAKSSDSERSINDKKVPTKGKRIGAKDTSKGDISSHKNSSEIKEKFDLTSKANRLDITSASSDLMDRSVPSSDSKNPFKSGLERRHVMSNTDSEEERKSKHSNANVSGHKRTLSTSGLKKQESDSSDSDYDQTSKKKRKKNKKTAKRNSDIDSSDSEAEAKKKKHKKHKKHSKKNKKHKKHKKKSKRAETSSSDDDTDSKPSKIQTIKGRFPAGINEDLEKQLRERALKSMKKID